MGCRKCGEERPPLLEMSEKSPTGRFYRCLSCGSSSPNKADIVEAVEVREAPSMQPTKAAVVDAEEPLPEPKKREPRQRRSAPDVGKTIREARAELKIVRADRKACERELKALKKAEDQLQKLLDAADGKSLAVVRQLRQSRN